ncbi:hypothetical protein NVV76_08930 [Pediococcus ethanolidurans]|uniref:hypothetical protein n=2 Tax=Pediococcus ethanolidurans TaxID=319653 RepID=UPI0020A7030F|nr:hypothetical protein [Pediococcus ethanolidurans]MCV3322047.1 hypothetical protein [Pediococcus ethanolidurans]MCV3323486.1 hypothetical protein [Pediococcus ethanolidurans]MCV3328282.1 hypothetical protein [Pediococcus ethanolidurans]MCV3555028.1 hypothetical protein [Pediococcus ethanolidurans]
MQIPIQSKFFWISFDIISELLRYLADTNKIGINKRNLEEMFVEFQEYTDADDPDEEIKEMYTGELRHVSTDSWLPEWKEYIAINIERYTREWVNSLRAVIRRYIKRHPDEKVAVFNLFYKGHNM